MPDLLVECRALSLGYYPKVRFEALILCEVMIMPPVFGVAATAMLAGGAEKRRDCWPSKTDAYKVLKARGTWKAWDDRVLRTYVVRYIFAHYFILNVTDRPGQENGLRALPTPEYPEGEGVTLKCTRAQEAVCYWLCQPHCVY